MEFEENKEKFEGKTQGIFYLGKKKDLSKSVLNGSGLILFYFVKLCLDFLSFTIFWKIFKSRKISKKITSPEKKNPGICSSDEFSK